MGAALFALALLSAIVPGAIAHAQHEARAGYHGVLN